MASWWLALFLVISVWTLSVPVSGNEENKLLNDLMMYPTSARPVEKTSDVLEVTFDLSFNSFVINEKDLTLTSIAYETQKWKSINGWDPEKYGGITKVVLATTDLWTPDITLFNSANAFDVQYGKGSAIMESDGKIMLIRSSNSVVGCTVDSLRFPYEALNCTLRFGSWALSGWELHLKLADKEVDLSNSKRNPTWTLKDAKAKEVTKTYACCPEPYYSIEYTVELYRKSLHYDFVFYPSFLLSVLTSLLFLFPIRSSERITLGVLLFCAFFVLLLYTSTLVLGWTVYPYFVKFLFFNLFVITLFTFLNAFIVKLSNFEDGQEVPKIVRTIMFGVLARIFCLKSIVLRNQSTKNVAPEFQFQAQPSGNYNQLTLTSEKQPLDPTATTDDLPEGEMNARQSLEADVALIRALTTRFAQNMKDGDHKKKCSQQWKDLATVINMLFFIIYKTVIIIAVGVVYIQVSED